MDEQKITSVNLEPAKYVKVGLRGLKGMGRKSNVAMVSIGGLAAVQQNFAAVVAVVIIALTSIITQTLLDFYDKDQEN